MNPMHTIAHAHCRRTSFWIGFIVMAFFLFSLALPLPAQSAGDLDSSFETASTLDGFPLDVVLPVGDGKIYIGGRLDSYIGTKCNGIARLHADGSLDTSFDPGTGADWVQAIALQPDGKVLIGGRFDNYNGTPREGIARINTDGSLDTSFNPGREAWVTSIALQPDGKVIIGGSEGILRLNKNGTRDASFNSGSGPAASNLNRDDNPGIRFSPVSSISLQPDGKILICGDFNSFDKKVRNGIARLHANGSLDTSFKPATGADYHLQDMALQKDGKVLICGVFSGYNGSERNGVARLNPDGRLDKTFNPDVKYQYIYSMVVQTDGKVVIGGEFDTGVARLNENGSLDSSFKGRVQATYESPDYVSTMALQSDGKVLISGDFGAYDSTLRSSFARILNDPVSQVLAAASPSRIEWLRSGAATEIEHTIFEYSPDGVVWSSMGNGKRIIGGWELTGLSLPATGQIRARGRTTTGGSSSMIEQMVSYSLGTATTLPTVTTAPISGVAQNAANAGGQVVASGGDSVTERGVVLAMTPNPTVAGGTKMVSGDGTGSFTVSLSGLASNTVYYIRAFASNSLGTAYGPQVSFTSHSSASTSSLSAFEFSNIGPLNPSFSPGTTNYTLTVENAVKTTRFKVDVTQAGSWVEKYGGMVTPGTYSQPIGLFVGNNTIDIDVVSQDGRTATNYRVRIIRKAPTYALLRKLTVEGVKLSPDFRAKKPIYHIIVPTNRDFIQIQATTMDEKAKITIGGMKVKSGKLSKPIKLKKKGNTFVHIVVTAENGSKKTYRVEVIKTSLIAG